ncbi:MAG: redoxin domain-containing protein [Fimbriiglobus sp.]|nr:redoxin domain-containing protein [Fimbriiglobus sp.]
MPFPRLSLLLVLVALLVGTRGFAQVPIPPTPAPELAGGTAWINTGKPLTLKDLKGKIVILDFWTLCCINCMHIMKELTELEEKYPNQLVVIGVHSPKFENEKSTEAVRKAVLRYELKHPVVVDSDYKIWKAYNAQWWPTITIIDPEGNVVSGARGEVEADFKAIEKVVTGLIVKHRKSKTLDETPLRFDTAKFRDGQDTPLYFPGKVVADSVGKRLLIADSTHHRVVVTDLTGKKIAIAGTGQPGRADGPFDKAQFDDPQGMAIDGDTVYLADRKNNCIRVLDLKTEQVTTLDGSRRTFQIPRTPRAMECTPWDLLLHERKLFVAMSGSHQIWVYDLKAKKFASFAGDASEEIADGPLHRAKFAQPSGLASDGKTLYVADAEVSAIRTLPLDGNGEVGTLVGRGLFEFGDRDGPGRVGQENLRKTTEALLQHPLGVAVYKDRALLLADTYNSKIKVIDLAGGGVTTFLGGPAKNGEEPLFNEPGGISVLDDTLYVADTNAHRIRVVDLKTKTVKTLELKGVDPVEKFKDEKPKK